jgi:hypothetical protein
MEMPTPPSEPKLARLNTCSTQHLLDPGCSTQELLHPALLTKGLFA